MGGISRCLAGYESVAMHKFRLAWLVLGCLWVATIFYLSLIPHPPEPIHFEYSDKLEHTLGYAALMLWFCQIYHQPAQRMLLAVLLIGMGIALELLQRMTGYRYFDYADMLANGTGVLLSWALAHTPLGRIYSLFEAKLKTA